MTTARARRSAPLPDREGPDPAPAADDGSIAELRVAVDRLSRLLASRRAYSRSIEAVAAGVSQQASMLLTTLCRDDGPLTLTTLATHSHIDLSAASRQLRDLERAALVVREPDPTDRRVTNVRLTAAGRRLADQLIVVRRSHLHRAVEDWPPAKRAQLAGLIDELVDALTNIDPAA
jgi:DNA-binding MarR family transcriptional regulator